MKFMLTLTALRLAPLAAIQRPTGGLSSHPIPQRVSEYHRLMTLRP